jgi:hypothetical protein
MATVYTKNAMRNAVEAASGGKVTVLFDDLENPSYMRRLAPIVIKDLYRPFFEDDDAWNASVFKPIENDVHPAFIKDGTVIRELMIGQYPACNLKNRACSLPGMDPWASINYDNALAACKNKGPGWTMNTAYIHGLIQALCLRQKYQPRGNTQYGRSHEMIWESGLRTDGGIPGNASGSIPRTKTGTGPVSWSHDGTESGIADLVGNVWEWLTLMKLVDGKIIMSNDNNINLAESAWPDTGIRFDATVGTSDGSGMDGDGDSGAPVLSDVITKYSGPPGNDAYAFKRTHIGGEGGFRSVTKKSGLTLPVSLILAGLAPIIHYDGSYEAENALKGAIWVRNYGTRLPIVGGAFSYTSHAGLGALHLYYARVTGDWTLGFRPAFLLI